MIAIDFEFLNSHRFEGYFGLQAIETSMTGQTSCPVCLQSVKRLFTKVDQYKIGIDHIPKASL